MTAAEVCWRIVMRRYERVQHFVDFEPPGRRLGRATRRRRRVTAMLDRSLSSRPRTQMRSTEVAPKQTSSSSLGDLAV